MIINFIIILISFLAMEFVAWFTHKYIMHGILWYLHKDHHQPHKKQILQKNDYFFIIFAIPGVAGILTGLNTFNLIFWMGIGITLYGLAYFIIHDIFIHQRLPFFKFSSSKYLNALRKAHKDHHKHVNKEKGENFGMLLFPKKYWK